MIHLLKLSQMKLWKYSNLSADGRSGPKRNFSFSTVSPHAVWFSDSSQVPQFCKSNHEGVPPELPAQLRDSAWPGKGLDLREWTGLKVSSSWSTDVLNQKAVVTECPGSIVQSLPASLGCMRHDVCRAVTHGDCTYKLSCQPACIWILAKPFTSSKTLSKSFNLSKLQPPLLKNGDNYGIKYVGYLGSVNVCYYHCY